MWTLVKNNLYSIRKILIITNLVAVILGIVFSSIWKDSIMMVPMYFFLSAIISISMTNKQISNNQKYNMFINNFGIKRKEIVKSSMILLLILSFLSIILSTTFILIMNSINNFTILKEYLSTIILMLGFWFFYINLLSEGVNYFNFKYGDNPKKNYRVTIMILLSVAIPQLFRLLDKIEIFSAYDFLKLSLKSSLFISLMLSVLGLLGTVAINKISQKNYEKREF